MKDIVIKSRVTRCPCPCCSAQMDGETVVCWACFRVTERLTPGVYPNDRHPGRFELSSADVNKWEQARQERTK